MCGMHWAMVPKDMQDEVYRTVKLRAKTIDASWAPWWRAAERAVVYVAKIDHPDHDWEPYLKMQMAVADRLERKALKPEPGTCLKCGCTDNDCSGCVERTGQSCYWADPEKTLCSACAPEAQQRRS